MKNRYQFFIVLVFVSIFLLYIRENALHISMRGVNPITGFGSFFYKSCAMTVVAAEQNMAPYMELAVEKSEGEPSAAAGESSSAEPSAAAGESPSAEPSAAAGESPSAEPSAATDESPSAEPTEAPEAGQAMGVADGSVQDTGSVTDYVSDGAALLAWLEAHKNTGGSVKLSDHVVLEGEYSYCPDGSGMPLVTVDTNQYTITVTGQIELMSDHQLVFTGQVKDNAIFCVTDEGMLSLMGVTVESGQVALWQEEGAGLVVNDCHISGHVRYADTPYVLDSVSVCIVVEKGQTIHDVLPTEIVCTVNRLGTLSCNEQLPVSWDLAGTDRQQEERRRLRLQGTFSQAAAVEAPVCTVVYNDYPLTFTEVRATMTSRMYMFQGWYTKPEEHLPITVRAEYSFDGENWHVDEEKFVKNANDSFMIAFPREICDVTTHPNIYIRLHWNDNGTGYFSNVLCYAAENLECEEDIGGSRGGGTSIVSPPDPPEQTVPLPPNESGTSQEEEQPGQNAEENNGSGSNDSSDHSPDHHSSGNDGWDNNSSGSNGAGASPDIKQAEEGDDSRGQAVADDGRTDNVEPLLAAKSKTAAERSEDHVKETLEVFEALSSYEKSGTYFSKKKEQALGVGQHRYHIVVLTAVIVLLSVAAGVMGFGVYSRRHKSRD